MGSPSCSEVKTTDLKKGSWTHEEDEMLKSYITRYGIWNWTHMPKYAGLSRSGKSCRLRWMNYLKPNVKRGKFSKEEEEIILDSHSLLGNRWSAIASKLPGRSDNDIKNYWHTHLKKRAPAAANHTLDHHQCTIEKQHDDMQNNHVMNNDRFGSLFVQTEDDSSSSSSSSCYSSTSSKLDHEEDEFNIDDICSPGTVKDLQCFWRQVFPLETTHHQDTTTTTTVVDEADIFSYSYNDPTFPYNHQYTI